MAHHLVGIDVTNSYTTAQLAQGKGFGLGDTCLTHDGKKYIFLQSTAAIVAGDVVYFTGNYGAIPLTTAAGNRGGYVAVAPIARAASDYGWFQRWGASSIQVLANCVQFVRLNTTATAGKLDDDGTVSSKHVQGIVIAGANGGATASVLGLLNDPFIDATL
jgi:hypothetical protein